MHLPIKNICVLGILPIAITLWNCTTDGETVTVGDDELSGIQIIDETIFEEPDDEDEEEEEIESSSSAKEEKSSSSKKSSAKSSSSKKSSSSQSETDEDSDSDKSSSSSSQKASSSSTKRILVPGVEESVKSDKSSSSKAKSSSSKAKSSSSKAESSSSEEEADAPSLSPIDSAIFESMETIGNSEQKEINRHITNKDSSFTKNESDSLDLSLLDFDQNDYLCKASDDKWHGITETTVRGITKARFGVEMYPITKSFSQEFGNICKEIYVRSKEAE